MFPAEFEPATSASERPQTQAIRSTATGIDSIFYILINQLITLSTVTASSDRTTMDNEMERVQSSSHS